MTERPDDPIVQLTACPQCEAPAEIQRRTILQSTDGPIEHAAVLCIAAQHRFLLPVASLARPAVEHVRPRAARGRAAQDASAHVERR